MRFAANAAVVPTCLASDLESFFWQVKRGRQHSSTCAPSACKWLSLGFHPAWSSALGKTMQAFNNTPWNRSLYAAAFEGRCEAPRLRIAWRNILPSVGARIVASNKVAVDEELRRAAR